MAGESSWFQRVAAALDRDAEGDVLAAVDELLGAGGHLTCWRPGREEWTRTHGPVDVLPAIPDHPGVAVERDGVLLRAGEDPTASRVAWLRSTSLDADQLEVVARLLRLALEGLLDRQLAADARRRLADNERIGRLGSYDWHVPTDTNQWSDELYRIYGEEPQSFNASYERFLAFIHPDDREKVQAIHQRAFQTGEPFEMEERIVLADGTERLLWSNGEVVPAADGSPERFIGICRDVTEQRAAEAAARESRVQARRAHDAAVRRRAALELNDVVVQGLTAAMWAAEAAAPTTVRAILEETMADAQRMMGDLLRGPGGEDAAPEPGELRRSEASPARIPEGAMSEVGDVATTTRRGGVRVVVADDSFDVRLLLRIELGRHGVEVVGEAANGREAVDRVLEHRPDVVLLDLSMPEMDGLEATRELRGLADPPRIVVVSGHGSASMARAAREAGADEYIEKGGDLGARVLETLGVTTG